MNIQSPVCASRSSSISRLKRFKLLEKALEILNPIFQDLSTIHRAQIPLDKKTSDNMLEALRLVQNSSICSVGKTPYVALEVGKTDQSSHQPSSLASQSSSTYSPASSEHNQQSDPCTTLPTTENASSSNPHQAYWEIDLDMQGQFHIAQVTNYQHNMMPNEFPNMRNDFMNDGYPWMCSHGWNM